MGPGLGALNFIVSGNGGEIVAADILNAGIGYILEDLDLKHMMIVVEEEVQWSDQSLVL